MKSSKLLRGAAVLCVGATALLSPALAQPGKESLYVYHTNPDAGCPGLDWHIVTEPNGSLMGFVAWDQMKHMARLEGMLSKSGTFKMDAHEVGGSRTAVVSGKAAGNNIYATIEGSGTKCDGKTLNIPRAVGGLGGGGG
ncbi:hypothetical protein [Rhodopila sp.]|uniref:hypothetical protein n=1 Tax=Rhodopila sp. TaxID=2480087 RepID=UPI003D0F9035